MPGGWPPAVAMASMAFAIARLSANFSALNSKNDGAMCIGGGNGDASMVERRPCASTKYSRS